MSEPFVDADVIIRLLTGDDPEKQAEAAALFGEVEAGRLTIAAPDTVIADAVYVLSSPRLYRLPRLQVEALLRPLVRLGNFRVSNKAIVQEALYLYASSPIDFGDAMIVASMQQAGSEVVYSYDADFDRLATVVRHTPGDFVP